MVQAVKVKHASVSVVGARECGFLQSFLAEQNTVSPLASPDLELISKPHGLELHWYRTQSKPLSFYLDFEKVARQLRSFPAPKQGAFNQALGKKTKVVIDATAGWGGDSLLMCLQGYKVHIIERLPIMATLLDEAFSRFSQSTWAANNKVEIPNIVCANATDILTKDDLKADCVYLDPMFPPKRKKSAAVNKNMQFLQWLAGADTDARQTAEVALANYSRLAIKRPDHAESLIDKPAAQFSSKLVHYDVYLNGQTA